MCAHVKDPVVHGVRVPVDYGNTNITSMHLCPRRRNVAAQVAEELKTDTYATAPMEKRRKKGEKSIYFLALKTLSAVTLPPFIYLPHPAGILFVFNPWER